MNFIDTYFPFFCVCVRHNTVRIYSFMAIPWPSKTPQLGRKEQHKIKTEICVPHPSTAARALRPTVASISPFFSPSFIPANGHSFFPPPPLISPPEDVERGGRHFASLLRWKNFLFLSCDPGCVCVCEGLRAIDVCVRRTRFSPRSFFPLYSQGVCSNL